MQEGEQMPMRMTAYLENFPVKGDGNGEAFIEMAVYDSDGEGRIDSWQKIRIEEGRISCGLSCRNGAKTVLAKVSPEPGRWQPPTSLAGAISQMSKLCDEDPESPVLYARSDFEKNEAITLNLSTMLAEVRVESLSCDFFGKPYEDATLQNVKAYLTNVRGSCFPFAEDQESCGGRIMLNPGGLCHEDVEAMNHPEMLEESVADEIGLKPIKAGIRLYCYPDRTINESPAERFTRLVIEGQVDGQTWYWPISINREGFGDVQGVAGIEAGTAYSYNITICSLGSTDPDTPVSSSQVRISCRIMPWEAMEESIERY